MATIQRTSKGFPPFIFLGKAATCSFFVIKELATRVKNLFLAIFQWVIRLPGAILEKLDPSYGMKKDLKVINQALHKNEDEMTVLKVRLSSLPSALEKVVQKMTTTQQNHAREIATLTSTKNALESNVQTLSTQITQLTGSLNTKDAMLIEKDKNIDHLKQQITYFQQHVNQIERQMSSFIACHIQLGTEKGRVLTDYQQSDDEEQELSTKVMDLCKEVVKEN